MEGPADADIRILLFDGTSGKRLRERLARHLEDGAVDLVVADGAGNGDLGTEAEAPDVLILDLAAQGSVDALERVRDRFRDGDAGDPPTVILAPLEERSDVVGELLSCAARGLRPEPDPDAPSLDVITPRQREILGLVARSHTSREIGEMLGISPRTVETHRANMMQRLGIHDVAGLVRFAVSCGLVDAEV